MKINVNTTLSGVSAINIPMPDVSLTPGMLPSKGFFTKGVKTGTKGLHIFIVLDESGSMGGRVDDVIQGLNSFIDRQKEHGDDATVSLLKFEGGNTVLLFEHMPITEFPTLTNKHYQPCGATNLLDALGAAIESIDKEQKSVELEERSDVLTLVITDGFENASHKYKKELIEPLIKDRTKNGWLFSYIGADIDSFSESNGLGFNYQHSASITLDNMSLHMHQLGDKVAGYRGTTVALASSGQLTNSSKSEAFTFTDEERAALNDEDSN